MLKKVRPVDSVQDDGSRGARRFLRVGLDVLTVTAGRRSPGDNETWWWNDKVQDVIKAKKEAMKMWETSARQIATGRQTRMQRKQ